MKIRTTFEKTARYYPEQTPKLRVTMRFEYCTHEDFYAWKDENQARLDTLLHDVGYSDKVIIFFTPQPHA